jgi:tetratricopeptide (TPR) repeat protein
LFAILLVPAIAQNVRILPSVKGTVIADESFGGIHLVVTLTDSVYRRETARSYLGTDGSFEFRDVATGTYTLEIGIEGGNAIQQQVVNIEGTGAQLEVRLTGPLKKPFGAGTVSVRQLQHPLSSKAKKIFDTAKKASDRGEYLHEIEILRSALNDPSAVPYARMNIGVAYMKAGQPASAVPELQEAVRLMPENPSAHTNLAYALLLSKHVDASEVECRKALQLDRNNAKARWVMGSVLLSKGSHEQEAVEDLHFASREIPTARMVLVRFYEQSGQKDAAVRELREFLPQASGEERTNAERWLSNLTK